MMEKYLLTLKKTTYKKNNTMTNEEILENIFIIPSEEDWYKPVLAAMNLARADERDNKVNTIIPLLNEIHAELAKSNLPAEQYQLISAMIIDVKQLVKPTIPHHLNNNL